MMLLSESKSLAMINESNSQTDSFSLMSLNELIMNTTLTKGQVMELEGLSPEGVSCLVESFINFNHNPIQGLYCNAVWDEIACWPATKAGSRATLACSEIMKNESRFSPEELWGEASRTCSQNGTWYLASLNDYQDCEESTEDILRRLRRIATPARYIVRYILYYGSIASIICLTASLFIFFYFKSIRCQRIKIHINMMLALLLKSILMLVMVHHTIFKKSFNYKDVDWVCKVVISLQFYATVAAINWMFVQGHYLNSKLKSIVVKKFPMRYYVIIGWGIPLGIVGIWSVSTEIIYGTKCWKDFTKMRTIWILVVSLSVVLLVNLFLLVNIIRLVISIAKHVNVNETLTSRLGVRSKIKRGTKAAAILFPLLGITNLVFFYNPGGTVQKYYMVAQASMHSLQGIVTSILYCFICKDVREAVRREYYKFQVKRGASVSRGQSLAVSFRSRDSRISTHLNRREIVQIQRVEINRRNEQASRTDYENDNHN